jgi:hypothetical protein
VAREILEGNVARAIQSEGILIDGKMIYGKTDVTVHDDGTADVRVESNGRTFECLIQLYIDGTWKVISRKT